MWYFNSLRWITYQKIQFIFNFASQQFPHNRCRHRQTDGKAKIPRTTGEARSYAIEEGERAHCRVVMRGLCVCAQVHMCVFCSIIAPLAVVIAWPRVSAHYHLNSFVAGFIRWLHTHMHPNSHTRIDLSPATRWRCLSVKCMQAEYEFSVVDGHAIDVINSFTEAQPFLAEKCLLQTKQTLHSLATSLGTSVQVQLMQISNQPITISTCI